MMLLRHGMLALAAPAFAHTSANMQIFAEKVKADKKALVAANMQPTESEARGLWPASDSCQQDYQAIDQTADLNGDGKVSLQAWIAATAGI